MSPHLQIKELTAQKAELEKNLGVMANKLLRIEEENADLLDERNKRRDWIDRARREAGFSYNVSFDVVWDEVLKVYVQHKSGERYLEEYIAS